jgi:hypothetical protein
MTSALLVIALASSPFDATHPRFATRDCARSGAERSSRGVPCGSLAFFELAPSSGAGMGTACACATITGAKGEVVTSTRASSAYCTKEGLATTGLTTTSMVSCGNNLPRVESDGTALGLLVEKAGTNSFLQSEGINVSPWATDFGGTGTAPVLTADQAVTPWGTTTAERIQLSATPTAADASDMLQSNTGFSGAVTCSGYVKGNATSGTIDFCSLEGAAWGCTPCAYVSGSWARCQRVSAAATATFIFQFGNNTNHNGGTARAAADIFAGGFQCETGSYATSYIPTTTVAASRVADDHVATIPSTNITTVFSIAGNATIPAVASSTTRLHGTWCTSGSTCPNTYVDSYATFAGWVGDSDRWTPASVTQATAAVLYPSTNRVSTSYDGTNGTVCINGNCAASAVTSSSFGVGTSFFRFGNYSAANGPLDGITSRICLDPVSTRCR